MAGCTVNADKWREREWCGDFYFLIYNNLFYAFSRFLIFRIPQNARFVIDVLNGMYLDNRLLKLHQSPLRLINEYTNINESLFKFRERQTLSIADCPGTFRS